MVVFASSLDVLRLDQFTNNVTKVLVAVSKFFQYDFLAAFLITNFLLVGRLAFFVEAVGVQFDVLSAVDRARTNVFHKSGVSALSALLPVLSNALHCPFRFHDLGSGLSLWSRMFRRGGGFAFPIFRGGRRFIGVGCRFHRLKLSQ